MKTLNKNSISIYNNICCVVFYLLYNTYVILMKQKLVSSGSCNISKQEIVYTFFFIQKML